MQNSKSSYCHYQRNFYVLCILSLPSPKCVLSASDCTETTTKGFSSTTKAAKGKSLNERAKNFCILTVNHHNVGNHLIIWWDFTCFANGTKNLFITHSVCHIYERHQLWVFHIFFAPLSPYGLWIRVSGMTHAFCTHIYQTLDDDYMHQGKQDLMWLNVGQWKSIGGFGHGDSFGRPECKRTISEHPDYSSAGDVSFDKNLECMNNAIRCALKMYQSKRSTCQQIYYFER